MRPIQLGDTGRGGGSPEPIFIPMEELQRVLGIGKTNAFALVGSGQIKSVKIGRKRLPVWESVKAYAACIQTSAEAA